MRFRTGDGKLDDLLDQLYSILEVINDRAKEIGLPTEEEFCLQRREVWLLMEHDWDGDPSMPGSSYVVGIYQTREAAGAAIFTENVYTFAPRLEILPPTSNVRWQARYAEGDDLQAVNAEALLTPWQHEWTDSDTESFEGRVRWVVPKTLP